MSQTLREILAPYVPERLLTEAEDAVSEYVDAQADAAFRDGKGEGWEDGYALGSRDYEA